MVAESDPFHPFVLGLTPCSETHAVEPLEPNSVSVTALSQQSPLRFIETFFAFLVIVSR